MSYRNAKEFSDVMGVPKEVFWKSLKLMGTWAARNSIQQELQNRGYSKDVARSMFDALHYTTDRTLHFGKILEVIRVREYQANLNILDRKWAYKILKSLNVEQFLLRPFQASKAMPYYGLHLPNMLKVIRAGYEQMSESNKAYVQRVMEITKILTHLNKSVFDFALDAEIEDANSFKLKLIAARRVKVKLSDEIKKAEKETKRRAAEKAEKKAGDKFFAVTDEGKLKPLAKNAMAFWHSTALENGYEDSTAIPESMTAKELGAMKNWMIEMFRAKKREPEMRKQIEFIIETWAKIRNKMIKKVSAKGFPFELPVPYGPEWWFFYANRREVIALLNLHHKDVKVSTVIDFEKARRRIGQLG